MIRLEDVDVVVPATRQGEPDRSILRDVTLELAEHRICVIGANGSGKSTFLRLLNGLRMPTRGRVIVAGRVSGTVRAHSRFEALPQGVVEADVTAPSFVVHEGATINGNLSMQQQEVTSGRQERTGSTTVVPRRNRGQ